MDTQYWFHHMGILSNIKRSKERFSEHVKMCTSDHEGKFRIQFYPSESDSPWHLLIKQSPPIALPVESLLESFEGKLVLLGPFEPIAGYPVAIINDGALLVELIETGLTVKEL